MFYSQTSRKATALKIEFVYFVNNHFERRFTLSVPVFFCVFNLKWPAF